MENIKFNIEFSVSYRHYSQADIRGKGISLLYCSSLQLSAVLVINTRISCNHADFHRSGWITSYLYKNKIFRAADS